MKKLAICAFGLAITNFGIQACKEVGPYISLATNPNIIFDTTYIGAVAAKQPKTVVMEEFTGVRCPNCPQGHVIINQLKSQFGEKFVAVSLHPINSLTAKYGFSVQDFRSDKAQSLFDYLGQIGLQPAASIDREKFSGENAILLDKNKWATKVESQISSPSIVNVEVEKSFNPATRELLANVVVQYTEDVNEPNKLTVLLTESGIVTAQLNGSIIDTFYVHNDVMREYASDINGDLLPGQLSKGRVFSYTYKYQLSEDWKPENMYIVAFVHEYVNGKRIYQGKEIHVID